MTTLGLGRDAGLVGKLESLVADFGLQEPEPSWRRRGNTQSRGAGSLS
jgi:hypothetical protein